MEAEDFTWRADEQSTVPESKVHSHRKSKIYVTIAEQFGGIRYHPLSPTFSIFLHHLHRCNLSSVSKCHRLQVNNTPTRGFSFRVAFAKWFLNSTDDNDKPDERSLSSSHETHDLFNLLTCSVIRQRVRLDSGLSHSTKR